MRGLKELYSENEYTILAKNRLVLIKDLSQSIDFITSKVEEMVEARKLANKIEHARDRAVAYANTVFPFLEEVRNHVDKVELIVDNELWPLPKYRELLFTR